MLQDPLLRPVQTGTQTQEVTLSLRPRVEVAMVGHPTLIGVLAGLGEHADGARLVEQVLVHAGTTPAQWATLLEQAGARPDRFADVVEAKLNPPAPFQAPARRLEQTGDSYRQVLASMEKSRRDAKVAAVLLGSRAPVGSPAFGVEALNHFWPDLAELLESIPGHLERASAAAGVMSKQVDVAGYDDNEINHVAYTEMMFSMGEQVRRGLEACPGGAILIIGPGPGNDVAYLADLFPDRTIYAVETDLASFGPLVLNTSARANVVPIPARGEDWAVLVAKSERLGTVPFTARALRRAAPPLVPFPSQVAAKVLNFSGHHHEDAGPYVRPARHELLPGGRLVIGEEFIGDDPDRRKAINRYHSAVIQEAGELPDPKLQYIENQARLSGLYAISPDPALRKLGCDFKRNLETELAVWRAAGFEPEVFLNWMPGAEPRRGLTRDTDPQALRRFDGRGGIAVVSAVLPAPR